MKGMVSLILSVTVFYLLSSSHSVPTTKQRPTDERKWKIENWKAIHRTVLPWNALERRITPQSKWWMETWDYAGGQGPVKGLFASQFSFILDFIVWEAPKEDSPGLPINYLSFTCWSGSQPLNSGGLSITLQHGIGTVRWGRNQEKSKL